MTTIMNINADGLDEVRRLFKQQPQIALQAARLAVNEAARFGRVQSSRQITGEVNLPKGYVDDRLHVSLSKSGEPVASITGRWRPTSLARFVMRRPVRGRPIKVRVKASGGTRTLDKAFPVKLRAGTSTETKFNTGIAVRIKKGGELRNSHAAKLLSEDKHGSVYLLYGPSINQVFRDVRYKVEAPIAERLSSEFIRQYQRLNRG